MSAIEEAKGGRIFFSNASRSLLDDDMIQLTSVGIDIGSSTTHLLFSHIELERVDARYVVTERRVLEQSRILLTPYRTSGEIDSDALRAFIAAQYANAGLNPDDIDTGSLILTGVAVRRKNARAIGELFSSDAGKFVVLSAGDALETVLAAYGSGAVALSERERKTVMNIDIGGGTTKIALCVNGKVQSITAVEAGARLVVRDEDQVINRIEHFGQKDLDTIAPELAIGSPFPHGLDVQLAAIMANRILAAARGEVLAGYLRLPPLKIDTRPDYITFSGGVSEFMTGASTADFNDLGPALAKSVLERVEKWGISVRPAREGIRATVVGASQYAVQVSGNTVYLDPEDVVPLRSIAVISPAVNLGRGLDPIDEDALTSAIDTALHRLDLHNGDRPVALAVPWTGSASYARLGAFCRAAIKGLDSVLAKGHPFIVVVDGDVGGLIGLHCRHEEALPNPIIAIDGIELKEFDFIDIGEIFKETGAVPVVIKSLLFPEA